MRAAQHLQAAVLFTAAAVGLSYLHPFGNPRNSMKTVTTQTLLSNAHMSEPARAVLVTKCADCHSNTTQMPVYARIAPGSWLIERDIMEGRAHMNLSNWDHLTPDEQQVLQSEIVQQSKRGHMPPWQYRTLHWNAKLTTQEVAALATLSKDIVASETSTNSVGDAARGSAVFNRRCTGCHALDADREGPHLRGVFGRKSGSVSGFSYSAALKNAGITWNEMSLDHWLSDTDELVPGNDMDFRVPKAAERADLIAFLKQSQ